MCNSKAIGIGLLFALVFSLNAQAKLCKWVGPDGEIHYGDVATAAEAGTSPGQGDKTGVDSCTEVLSPEAARAKAQEAARIEQEKKRRANALRNTYSSEKEIDLAFERNAALVTARLDTYDVQLKSARDTLADLGKYVDERKREGKAIPQSAYDDTAQTEQRVARLESERAKVEDELKALKARCEEDKVLYRKISVMAPADDTAPTIDHTYPYSGDSPDSSYPCCTKSKRARKAKLSSQS